MPQLDKLSFMSQYLWLTIFFFVFYYFVLNFFVVFMFKNLKLRALLNELYYFRIFKTNYDRGILNYTNKLEILYYNLMYSLFFFTFSCDLKKKYTFFSKNIFVFKYLIDINKRVNNFIIGAEVSSYKTINNYTI